MTISAYVENFKPCNATPEEYINYTTLAQEVDSVTKMIKDYREGVANEEVIFLLDSILNNQKLLNKTTIVWDGSYRNISILVRPDGFVDTSYVFDKSITSVDSALGFYSKHAETFFLLLDDETWEDIRIEEESFYSEF